MVGGVAAHIHPFGRAVIRRLDVEQPSRAWCGSVPRASGIGDRGQAESGSGNGWVLTGLNFDTAEINVDAEIYVALAHRIAEILELHVRVAACIDNDDAAAAPPHHLVEAEIIKVPSVGEVYPATLIGCRAGKFLQSW